MILDVELEDEEIENLENGGSYALLQDGLVITIRKSED